MPHFREFPQWYWALLTWWKKSPQMEVLPPSMMTMASSSKIFWHDVGNMGRRHGDALLSDEVFVKLPASCPAGFAGILSVLLPAVFQVHFRFAVLEGSSIRRFMNAFTSA